MYVRMDVHVYVIRDQNNRVCELCMAVCTLVRLIHDFYTLTNGYIITSPHIPSYYTYVNYMLTYIYIYIYIEGTFMHIIRDQVSRLYDQLRDVNQLLKLASDKQSSLQHERNALQIEKDELRRTQNTTEVKDKWNFGSEVEEAEASPTGRLRNRNVVDVVKHVGDGVSRETHAMAEEMRVRLVVWGFFAW
jgi:hypothetical protein